MQSHPSLQHPSQYQHIIAEMAELLEAGWQHIGDDCWLPPDRDEAMPRHQALREKRGQDTTNPIPRSEP